MEKTINITLSRLVNEVRGFNLSPREVEIYRIVHHHLGWCGDWVFNFLSEFLLGEEASLTETWKEVLERYNYYRDDEAQWEEYELSLRWRAMARLGRPKKRVMRIKRGGQ